MWKRFKDRYRIGTARLRDYDYASPGWYFVTICTKNRACLFGEIRSGVVGLSEIGCVAHRYWTAIPDHFDHARLDAFIVMPNHVHGIIKLLPLEEETIPVETLHATSLRQRARTSKNEAMSEISPSAGSLSTIIRSYKSAVTRRVRKDLCADFTWQSRFYEHIIRGPRTLQAIRRYIADNPLKWHLDKNHPANL